MELIKNHVLLGSSTVDVLEIQIIFCQCLSALESVNISNAMMFQYEYIFQLYKYHVC